jgi:hypothetical protein
MHGLESSSLDIHDCSSVQMKSYFPNKTVSVAYNATLTRLLEFTRSYHLITRGHTLYYSSQFVLIL